MMIEGFGITNYKCFLETDWVELGPGFNVLVGKNNSGKSALLEALALEYGYSPHRSPETMPERGDSPPEEVRIDLDIAMNEAEIQEGFKKQNRLEVPESSLNEVEGGGVELWEPDPEDQWTLEAKSELQGDAANRPLRARSKPGLDIPHLIYREPEPRNPTRPTPH